MKKQKRPHEFLPEEILKSNISLFPSFVRCWGDKSAIKFADKLTKEWKEELKHRGVKSE